MPNLTKRQASALSKLIDADYQAAVIENTAFDAARAIALAPYYNFKPDNATDAKPDAKPATSPAVTSRGLARDAATVVAQRTNFAQYSDRDTAYLAFFGSVMRLNGNTATLALIHESGTAAGNGKRSNPYYTGSAKATDAGAINRLIKAGYILQSDNGNSLLATDKAIATKAYSGKA